MASAALDMPAPSARRPARGRYFLRTYPKASARVGITRRVLNPRWPAIANRSWDRLVELPLGRSREPQVRLVNTIHRILAPAGEKSNSGKPKLFVRPAETNCRRGIPAADIAGGSPLQTLAWGGRGSKPGQGQAGRVPRPAGVFYAAYHRCKERSLEDLHSPGSVVLTAACGFALAYRIPVGSAVRTI
jgi:hypothetical protein